MYGITIFNPSAYECQPWKTARNVQCRYGADSKNKFGILTSCSEKANFGSKVTSRSRTEVASKYLEIEVASNASIFLVQSTITKPPQLGLQIKPKAVGQSPSDSVFGVSGIFCTKNAYAANLVVNIC